MKKFAFLMAAALIFAALTVGRIGLSEMTNPEYIEETERKVFTL